MSGAWGDDMLDWDRDDDPRPVHSAPAQQASTSEPIAWRWRTRLEDNWTFSGARLSLNDIGRTAPTFQEEPLYATPQAQEPACREALEQALDAIQGQCDAMRSLKGWRLNLIRENLAKAGAALAASSQHSGQKSADDGWAFAKELSDALIKVRPLGGSELFVQRNGKFYADPAYCGAAIQELHTAHHEAMKSLVRERKASQSSPGETEGKR